jgi:cytochrome c oxidase subunit 3
MWWGTLGMMAIEGTVFALAMMAYFYLRSHAGHLADDGAAARPAVGHAQHGGDAGELPARHLAKRPPSARPARRALWLVVSLLFGVAFLVVRGLEFAALNVRWDSNAYGSVVWLLLGCTPRTSSPT